MRLHFIWLTSVFLIQEGLIKRYILNRPKIILCRNMKRREEVFLILDLSFYFNFSHCQCLFSISLFICGCLLFDYYMCSYLFFNHSIIDNFIYSSHDSFWNRRHYMHLVLQKYLKVFLKILKQVIQNFKNFFKHFYFICQSTTHYCQQVINKWVVSVTFTSCTEWVN